MSSVGGSGSGAGHSSSEMYYSDSYENLLATAIINKASRTLLSDTIRVTRVTIDTEKIGHLDPAFQCMK
jgi:hypothetical protein